MQKGVTGMGYNQWDMLMTSEGVVPGLILNPHAIPSRMTIGQLIEGLAGKVAALEGALGDATIFKKVDLDAIGNRLEELGYDRHGSEYCFDGKTGEYIDKKIFITPTYYQRLQKFVVDEVYSISTGPTCAITRQPVEGKNQRGGLRIGEMEKDVLVAAGASLFLSEKFKTDSDGFEVYICRTCGFRAVANPEEGIAFCNRCSTMKQDSDIVKLSTTWSSSLFLNEIESCNISVSLGIEPYSYSVHMNE